MATFVIVYIDDEIVGPCLGLIRRVCEPNSASRPHITVRGPVRRLANIPDRDRNLRIREVDILEPGCFEFSDPEAGKKTVFIGCHSEQLTHIVYKPDYPESIFHVTMYDGSSTEFAERLLRVLQTYKWRFKVALPEGTRLTVIDMKRPGERARVLTSEYEEKVRRLFQHISSEEIDSGFVNTLSDARRLELVGSICGYLHRMTANYPRVGATEESLIDVNRIRHRSKQECGKKGCGNESPCWPASDDERGTVEDVASLTSNQLGQFVTPPELARDMAEYARSVLGEPVPAIHFGDPSIGTGTFFSAVYQAFPRERIASAIGVELDPQRATFARRRWSGRGLDVTQGIFSRSACPKENTDPVKPSVR